jgi:hypothetical protein
MKLGIRIIALSVFFTGVAAVSVSSAAPGPIPTHQSATAAMPIPTCAPGLPGCPDIP